MIASEFVAATYLKSERKLPTFVSGSSKWLVILGIANEKIDAWQNEPDADWDSLYNPIYSIGTVSATDTYDLNDKIRMISQTPGDTVTITHLNSNKTEYRTIQPADLKRYPTGNYCAKIGKTLVFNKAFKTSDPQFGGTITAPVYIYASHLVNDNDVVPVDDPRWLVTATAAEYNRGDIVKQNQYPTLINEANALMDAMKAANGAETEEVERTSVARGSTW